MWFRAALTAFILMASPALVHADMAFKYQSGVKLFQHYAQASCLATAFSEGEIYDQAISALNGYREFDAEPIVRDSKFGCIALLTSLGKWELS